MNRLSVALPIHLSDISSAAMHCHLIFMKQVFKKKKNPNFQWSGKMFNAHRKKDSLFILSVEIYYYLLYLLKEYIYN